MSVFTGFTLILKEETFISIPFALQHPKNLIICKNDRHVLHMDGGKEFEVSGCVRC
jgi:hypothetical protein